jgi:hypothetical protein
MEVGPSPTSNLVDFHLVEEIYPLILTTGFLSGQPIYFYQLTAKLDAGSGSWNFASKRDLDAERV